MCRMDNKTTKIFPIYVVFRWYYNPDKQMFPDYQGDWVIKMEITLYQNQMVNAGTNIGYNIVKIKNILLPWSERRKMKSRFS
jgi:hypothetical protein